MLEFTLSCSNALIDEMNAHWKDLSAVWYLEIQ